MDKQEILKFIENQLTEGKISKTDLADFLGVECAGVQAGFVPAQTNNLSTSETNSKNLTHILYGIGAIIAIVGVGILVAQNWREIGFAGRILVTLGISLITYIIGLFLTSEEKSTLSQVMFVISAALAPLGSYVLLEEASIDFSWFSQFLTAIILFVFFAVALFISKRSILVLLTVGFASWAYYALLMKIFDFDSYSIDLLKWATMLLGMSYIFIAYGYQRLSQTVEKNEKKSVKNILYGLGTLAILGAGISVGGLFDIFFIALIFAAFYGSVYLKSRSMLIFGAVFLMAHIIKLTSKYFVDSVGWPVALIGIGFLVIGVGYVTFYLNKKFISNK